MATSVAEPPKLTPQQDAAIHARGVSVALSAGAGCGKTFVLTERYLAQLTAPDVQLRELVAITFTERAAREMRDRIRNKCLERVQHAADDAQAQRWWRLLRELDSARVSTIHSFCGALLRSHAVAAELDPGFQVLEESTASTLLAEITDDLLRGWLAEQRPDVLELIVRFSLDGLRERLYAFVRGSAQALDRWAGATPDELLATWEAYHRNEFLSQVAATVSQTEESHALLALLEQLEIGPGEMRARRQRIQELLPHLADSRAPVSDLLTIRENAKVQGSGIKGSFADPEDYENFKTAARELRKSIDAVKSLFMFDHDSARPSAEAGLQLLALAQAVREAYIAEKRRLPALDFDDLIERAHRLLTDPQHEPLRDRITHGISLLLVDEFQDTDPVQVELVRALCGEGLSAGKLFFVGDRKQSIYRFRGAAPAVFRQLQDEMPSAGRLPLTMNFRSEPGVIDFVNTLFSDRFSDYEALVPHRPQLTPLPAVEFWWTRPSFERNKAGHVSLARRHEAHFLARRLREMFDAGKPLIPDGHGPADALRPLRFGDVCILFRALSDVQHYEHALQEFDIPYYLVGGHAFYAQQEIFDVLNLLRALDCIADEVALAGVLRSPFFSLTDEALFWLAQHCDGLAAGLYDTKLPSELSAEQRSRVEFAAGTLRDLRAAKDRLPIAELLSAAIERTGYDAILMAEFLGERKLANLRKLIDEARTIDRAGLHSLAEFVMQLSDSVAVPPKEALAATHAEAANVVRLMTIHQSKGLEFPFVIVADVDRTEQSRAPSAVLNTELGPLVKVADAGGDEPACVGLDMYNQIEQAENDAEIDRLLYVATTRAADRLVLSGSLFDKPGSRWTKLLAERFDLSSGEHLDPLTGGAIPHAAVLENPVGEEQPSSSRRTKVDWEQVLDQAGHLSERKQGIVPPQAAPILPDLSARRQYSFSRLTGALREEQRYDMHREAARRRDPDSPPPSDPLGLGTLVHAVLADLNFAQPAALAKVVQHHAALHARDDAAMAAEATRMIERFIRSERAKTLAATTERHVELEFLLAWPPDAPQFDGPFLHGFLDCLYQDASASWHILDYKTNRVTPESLAETANEYVLQMGVYALAAEMALGVSPASLTLCFLHAGLEHPFPWNASVRQTTIKEVNRLLQNAST